MKTPSSQKIEDEKYQEILDEFDGLGSIRAFIRRGEYINAIRERRRRFQYENLRTAKEFVDALNKAMGDPIGRLRTEAREKAILSLPLQRRKIRRRRLTLNDRD